MSAGAGSAADPLRPGRRSTEFAAFCIASGIVGGYVAAGFLTARPLPDASVMLGYLGVAGLLIEGRRRLKRAALERGADAGPG